MTVLSSPEAVNDLEKFRSLYPFELDQEETHFWCLHCETIFPVGWYRPLYDFESELIGCPVRNCSGTAIDFWEVSQQQGEHGFIPDTFNDWGKVKMYPDK